MILWFCSSVVLQLCISADLCLLLLLRSVVLFLNILSNRMSMASGCRTSCLQSRFYFFFVSYDMYSIKKYRQRPPLDEGNPSHKLKSVTLWIFFQIDDWKITTYSESLIDVHSRLLYNLPFHFLENEILHKATVVMEISLGWNMGKSASFNSPKKIQKASKIFPNVSHKKQKDP